MATPAWTREMQTKSQTKTLTSHRPSNSFQSSVDTHPRRIDSKVQRCEKNFGKIRQWNFGKPAVGVGDFMQDAILPPPKAVAKCESSDSPVHDMREMRSGDPKQSWMMTIPNSTFGEGEDWGLLRDAQVRFEPDRIIVEAHDRLGHSRIIHCSDIPRRLDTESSTYKVDPNGLSVSITLKIYKSLPGENVIEKVSVEKDDIIDKMKDKINSGQGDKVKCILGCQVDRPRGGGVSPSTAKDFL